MANLDIAGADGHRIAQILFDRLIGAIYLVAGREIQALGDGFRIGGNLGLVAVHHIGHALQLVFCSSTAGDRLGLPYGPGGIVETGDVLPALGGIIAIGLGAHLDAAGSHSVKSRDVLGQSQGQSGTIGGNADIIARCQVCGAAGNRKGVVQGYTARSRVTSQFQSIPESSHRMSRAVPIGIADAAGAIGARKFRRCGITSSDGGGFVGTAAVRSYDLDGASLASVSRSPFRTGSDGIKGGVLVQSDGKAFIGHIRQHLDVLGGVFRIFLPAAALDLEDTSLVYMDRSGSIIALEVHALGFHSLQLSHIHRIGILSTGSQVGDLAGNSDILTGIVLCFTTKRYCTIRRNPNSCIIRSQRRRCQIPRDAFVSIRY